MFNKLGITNEQSAQLKFHSTPVSGCPQFNKHSS